MKITIYEKTGSKHYDGTPEYGNMIDRFYPRTIKGAVMKVKEIKENVGYLLVAFDIVFEDSNGKTVTYHPYWVLALEEIHKDKSDPLTMDDLIEYGEYFERVLH